MSTRCFPNETVFDPHCYPYFLLVAKDFLTYVNFTEMAEGLVGGNMAGQQGVGQNMVDFDDDSWLGSLFNKNPNIPKKAMGGPVEAGKSYVVGEDGPELLLSGMNGTVIPNAGPAGGSMAALGGIGNLDSAQLQSALEGNTGDSVSGANNGTALAEAQLNRLDQLITVMARNNSVNEEILHATRQ